MRLDKFLAVPQLFLTGLQVLMKIMSIFPHQLSTCVTTALKSFEPCFGDASMNVLGDAFGLHPMFSFDSLRT